MARRGRLGLLALLAAAGLVAILWLAHGSGAGPARAARPAAPVHEQEARDRPATTTLAPRSYAPVPAPPSTAAAVRKSEGLSIEGVVLDEDGETPVLAELYADRRGPVPTEEATGRFAIRDLEPRVYELRVSLPHGSRARGLEPEGPVTVMAGSKDVGIVLRPCAWVTFRFLDATSGDPIVTRRTVRELREAETIVRLSAVGPGDDLPQCWHFPRGSHLRLRATADGYVPSDVVEIRLDPRERDREVTFRLVEDPSVWARLDLLFEDETGGPVSHLHLMQENSGFTGTDHQTNAGPLSLRLVAGRHHLLVGAPVFRRALDQPWLSDDVEVELERGEQRTLSVVLRRGGWLLRPVDAVWITIRDDADEVPVRFDWIRGAGAFGLLPPGTYEVSAESSAGEPLRGRVRIVAGEVHEVRLEPVR